jgi:hypothetical protein
MMNDKDVAVEVQQEQRCASQLTQAQEEPVRGRIARRRGRINRSRSLYNKSLTKEDSMTQPVITQWSHLFVRRRASSVDSPRVSPPGESSAASAPPLSTPPQELDLNTTASEEEQLAPWGDELTLIDEGKVLRCVYQNVAHSLSTRGTDPGLPQLAVYLRETQCGVAICAETNINWRRHKFAQEVRTVFQRASTVHMSTTCSGMGDDDAFKNKRFLPGGAAILTFNHWACTVLESGQDEYDCGWWCYTTLQGRNKKLFTTVGFYRSIKLLPVLDQLPHMPKPCEV